MDFALVGNRKISTRAAYPFMMHNADSSTVTIAPKNRLYKAELGPEDKPRPFLSSTTEVLASCSSCICSQHPPRGREVTVASWSTAAPRQVLPEDAANTATLFSR